MNGQSGPGGGGGGGGKFAGPFAGTSGFVASQYADDRVRRAKALELAVETVQAVRGFTNFQVVHTADLYEKYIADGTLPPRTQPDNTETEGESADGAV